jgi:adsorption protein B
MGALDAFAAACLVPLAIAAVISGMDELVLDMVTAWRWLRGRCAHGRAAAAGPPPPDLPEKRIAIFLPLWQEEAVVGSMLAHNIGAIQYSEYHFFVGVYPNDLCTMDAVRAAEVRFPNVHLSIVPHNGPTSKADCLNWIFQSMVAHEEACGVRFDVVVTHDAEDVIHPSSLRWINHYAADYDMVQVPVLPLSTPLRDFTHGVYCDEFAEFQTKDVPARRVLGGFLPSIGWRPRRVIRFSIQPASPRTTTAGSGCTKWVSARFSCRFDSNTARRWRRASTSHSDFARRCGNGPVG